MRNLVATVGSFVLTSSVSLVPEVAFGQGQCSAFVTSTALDQAAHFLDGHLDESGSFAPASVVPNGVATDGSLIWIGHFTTEEGVAYDQSGRSEKHTSEL